MSYTLDDLREHLGYLATPYSLQPDLDDAAAEAAEIAGALLKRSVYVYSPIAHCHTVGLAADIDLLDDELWLKHCKRMADRFDILIIADMPGWKVSKGVAVESKWFGDAGRPVFLLNPDTLSVTKLR